MQSSVILDKIADINLIANALIEDKNKCSIVDSIVNNDTKENLYDFIDLKYIPPNDCYKTS